MRYVSLLLAVMMFTKCAYSQPSYSDRDDSDFKVHARKSNAKSSPIFGVGDTVIFPKGALCYANLNDLRYYEGPETTSDERVRFNGKFLIGDRGNGSIRAVSSYVDRYGSSSKAYRVLIFHPGYLNGKKLEQRHWEGWLPGEYGMTRR